MLFKCICNSVHQSSTFWLLLLWKMLGNLKGEQRAEKLTQAKQMCASEWQQFDLTIL